MKKDTRRVTYIGALKRTVVPGERKKALERTRLDKLEILRPIHIEKLHHRHISLTIRPFNLGTTSHC